MFLDNNILTVGEKLSLKKVALLIRINPGTKLYNHITFLLQIIIVILNRLLLLLQHILLNKVGFNELLYSAKYFTKYSLTFFLGFGK